MTGSSPVALRTLHILQLLLQQHSLQHMTSDPVSVTTKPSRLSPLFGSMRSTPPPSGGEAHATDLSTRVCDIVGISVKTVVFRQQPFADRDTQWVTLPGCMKAADLCQPLLLFLPFPFRKFNEPVDLTASLHVLLRSRPVVDHVDLAFARFLLRYLHCTLYSILQRVGGSCNQCVGGSCNGWAGPAIGEQVLQRVGESSACSCARHWSPLKDAVSSSTDCRQQAASC